ncbi:hypothetical protein BH23GEM6_BH23GEM6_14760 [soil metagenome]
MAGKLDLIEKLVSLAKRCGYVFRSSEIYGGTGSVWDYGPLEEWGIAPDPAVTTRPAFALPAHHDLQR